MTHRILLCGDFENAEMRTATDAVARYAPKAEVCRVFNLREISLNVGKEAIDGIAWTPDLIVVAQQRPEEFTLPDVRRLQARYPLARCVCCCGAWCESDGRNSTLWPDAVRVPARTAGAR